tara:strand:+ start:202 stop:1221 length:1020 start_codon:yes stop_codon:yes gene_type:complete
MKLRLLTGGLLIICILMQTACQESGLSRNGDVINTVNGAIKLEALGFALTHEHIMSNYGKAQDEASIYDETRLLAQTIPYLRQLKSLGVHSVFDCTTAYFGRRVDLLQRISDSTGIQIITNTGFYGAAADRYIPPFAYQASVGDISKIWVDEFTNGIDGTHIKPGFVKLGFDDGAPSDIDTKLFIAGILTHKKTGLTLSVHTGNNVETANMQMELLQEYDVDPSAWIWVHANKVTDVQVLLAAANKGAWISLDGVNTSNIMEYIDVIKSFRSQKLLHKILLSHDGNGFRAGGGIRAFDAIPKDLVPAMLASGFTQDEIDQIMVQNPAKAFKIAIKNALP